MHYSKGNVNQYKKNIFPVMESLVQASIKSQQADSRAVVK